MTKRKPLTEAQTHRILKTAQFLGVTLEAIGIEMQMDLTDTRFKNPVANNHLRLAKNGIAGVKQHLESIVKAKDKDELEYDFAIEVHRLITHFCGYSTDKLKDFNDKIEEMYNGN